MYDLRQETPEDWWEVEGLFDLAFGPGRTGLSSYRLRDGRDPIGPLCLVARDPERILAGAIRFWDVVVGSPGTPSLLLGPVAVHPTRQGEGLGAELIGQSLDLAAEAGWQHVLLVGDEPYYKRFGFTADAAADVTFPPPTARDRILGQILSPGPSTPLAGEVRIP